MIIACSTKTLKLVEKSIFERRSKDDPFPLVVTDPAQLEVIRSLLNDDPAFFGALWNIDIEETPLQDHSKTQIGIHRTGFLYNRDFGTSVVLNALDCTDMSTIGKVARSGIESIFHDMVIPPEAGTAYFDDIAEKTATLLERAQLSASHTFARQPPTLIIPNNDRSAASVISRLEDDAYFTLHRDGDHYVSSEPVDRYLSFSLSTLQTKVRRTEKNPDGYVTPLESTRRHVMEKSGDRTAAAVTIKVQLAEHDGTAFDPPCYRDITVPLDAPLAWIHSMIQKVFNWADYHLHHFDFLDRDALTILNDAFEDIFDIDSTHWQEAENRFAKADGERLFRDLTNLSLKWLYGDFTRAVLDEGVLEQDFPIAHLPESTPLGLALFGSSAYPTMLQDLSEPKASLPIRQQDYQALCYEYDYGDGWSLAITPLELLNKNLGDVPVITGAQGHTPPEDCGGLGGFVDFLKDIDPHDDYKREGIDLLRWARGNGWRPFTTLEALSDQFDAPSTWNH